MARSTRRKSSSLRVNLSNVEERVKVPEGEHPMKVLEVSSEEGQNGTYLKWKFLITDGEAESGIVYYNTSLLPQALWNLKGLLRALQYDIPDDEFELPLDEFVDLECVGLIEHELYDGKKQSRLSDFWPLEKAKPKKSTKDEDEKPAKGKGRKDEEDEKPSRSKRGSKKSKTVSSDEIEDMDEDELADFVDEHELEVDLDDYKTLRKKRAAVIDAGQEAGIIED
jgi:hypothetical protein